MKYLILGVLMGVVLATGALASFMSHQDVFAGLSPAPTPTLKTATARIVGMENYFDPDTATDTVLYAYASTSTAPFVAGEVQSLRKENSQTILARGKYTTTNCLCFMFKNDPALGWVNVEEATATLDVFNRATKPTVSWYQKLINKVFAQTSGPNFPGTAADDASVGTIAWTSINNIKADDGSFAQAILTGSNPNSHYAEGTNFSFAIPAGSTINGITVEWKKRVGLITGGDTVQDNAVRIIKGGVVQTTDKSDGTTWASVFGYTVYGGASDLWGATWTSADINASTFGAAMQARLNFALSTDAGRAQLDAVRITIAYSATASNPIPFKVSGGLIKVGPGGLTKINQ